MWDSLLIDVLLDHHLAGLGEEDASRPAADVFDAVCITCMNECVSDK